MISLSAKAHSSRTSRAAKGALISFLQYGTQIGLQIVLSPIVLKLAGQETLGAYSVLMQALGYLAMVDLGFGLALGRYLAQSYAANVESNAFQSVFTTGRTFTLCSNLVFALLTFVFSFFLRRFLILSVSLESQARWALWILACWAVLRTPVALYGNGLIATQNLASANGVAIAGNTCRAALSVVFIALHMDLWGLALANVLAELVTCLTQRIVFRRLYPGAHFGWGLPDRALFRSMLVFGLQAMFVNLGWRFVSGSDSIVLGTVRNVATVSIFYTTQMPSVISYNIVNRIADNATPAINELYGRKAYDQLAQAFLRITRYSLLLAAPLFIGLSLLTKYLIASWVGPQQYAGDSATWALALFTLMISVDHISVIIVMATGRVRTFSLLTIAEGLIHVGLAIWLGRRYEIAGVAWAGVLAHIPAFVYVQAHALTELGIDPKTYLRKGLLSVSLPTGVCFILVHFALLAYEQPAKPLANLLINGSLLTLSYSFLAWRYSLCHEDRSALLKLLPLRLMRSRQYDS